MTGAQKARILCFVRLNFLSLRNAMLCLYSPDQPDIYLRLLRDALPEWEILGWPDAAEAADAVTHVAAWGAPPGFFARFPHLQVVFSLGAGVDSLLQRDDLAASVKIVRLLDAGMAQQMTEYCLYGLLHYQRAMDIYRRQQQAEQWTPRDARRANNLRVSILGLGELGQRVAGDLSGMGYVVQGWSRRARQIEGVDCRHGEAGLDQLLMETDVLFCLLPATQNTRHLLDARRLALLPEGAAIINGGRGSLIDEDALLALLDGESLRFAMLDVFAVEPLPSGHPFWKHPRVIITPHVAADTVPADAVAQVAANLRKHAAGLPMDGGVDRLLGY